MKNMKWTAILVAVVLTVAFAMTSSAMAASLEPVPVEESIVHTEALPVEEPVVEETPVVEPVVEETPVVEPVVEETPVEEPVVEETVEEPVEETVEEPAEEIVIDDEEVPLAGPTANASISVFCNRDAAAYGDVVTMTAEIVGFEHLDYSLQWQVCRNGEWINVADATDNVYSYTYSEAYEGCAWRVELSIA